MKVTCSRHAPAEAWAVPLPENMPFGAFEILSDKELPWGENRFGNTVMYWHLANFWPEIDPHHQLGVINQAWQIINFEINPLQIEATSDFDKAPITIYWVDKDDMVTMSNGRKFKSPFLFSQAPGTLAVNYACAPGHPHSQDCFINGSILWQVGPKAGKFELLLALVHEFLHGLGLNHTDASKDLLNAYYDPSNWITRDTRNGLNFLLGRKRREAALALPAPRYFLEEIIGVDPEKLPETKGEELKIDLSDNKGCKFW